MKTPQVEYPCWWTYALIGPDEEALRLAVGALTHAYRRRVTFSKESAHKRYVSIHVDVWVESAEVRNALFQSFQAHPAVKMVL